VIYVHGGIVSVVGNDGGGNGRVVYPTPEHEVIDLVQGEVHVLKDHPAYTGDSMTAVELMGHGCIIAVR